MQTINFSLVKPKNQVLFVSFGSLIWTTFLAYMKVSDLFKRWLLLRVISILGTSSRCWNEIVDTSSFHSTLWAVERSHWEVRRIIKWARNNLWLEVFFGCAWKECQCDHILFKKKINFWKNKRKFENSFSSQET